MKILTNGTVDGNLDTNDELEANLVANGTSPHNFIRSPAKCK